MDELTRSTVRGLLEDALRTRRRALLESQAEVVELRGAIDAAARHYDSVANEVDQLQTALLQVEDVT